MITISQISEECDYWTQFLEFIKTRCSSTAYGNWFDPIKVLEFSDLEITLEIPNIFVKEYLLSNYKKDLLAFLPTNGNGEPAINFIIARPKPRTEEENTTQDLLAPSQEKNLNSHLKLNENYRFEHFIPGPKNLFVKSAAMGVAARPGRSYNPLFIHGGVGLGKTHLLHSIGHHVKEHHSNLRIQCITTEAFINDLVDHLRKKSVDQMKRFYRSQVDILLVDDIQFLQNRLNFEEEFCNTFEALINQNKQIVMTSDKPPGELVGLSSRMRARMEWGLVVKLEVPELETRVAILQDKAQKRGLDLNNEIAFYVAEHMYNNVRQLEGAVNRLSAHCRLLNLDLTIDLVEKTLRELLQHAPKERISVEQILRGVASAFEVSVQDLKGSSRVKEVALPRQVAMYLARRMIKGTLQTICDSFGKRTHSTILHACRSVEKKVTVDETLRRQINMIERNIAT